MPAWFTRQGDDGFTGLLGEGRVAKHDLRMEAIGALDEANAALGAARSLIRTPGMGEILLKVQRDLYGLMAETAATTENAAKFRSAGAESVRWLEEQVEAVGQKVTLPKEFIVPGDSVAGAFLDLARTIVRRAERRMAALLQRGDVQNPYLLQYLNRLSSLCFLLELQEIQAAGVQRPTQAKKNSS